MTTEIQIKAKSKHNAYSLVLIGIVALLLMLLLSKFYWQDAKLVLIFLISVCLVTIFIGCVKILEPDNSVILTAQTLTYQHKYGRWQLYWPDIAHINQISETIYLDRVLLPYLGIKLNNLDNLISTLSPRLASRLIHEQRPLIHFCLQHNLLTLEEVTINFTPYLHNKIRLTGPIAAFLHHSTALKKAFGYDLYLPASALDRDCQAFASMLSHYKNSVNK